MDLGQCSKEHADEIQQFKWKQTEFGKENSLHPVAVGTSLLIYFWLPGAMFTLLSRLNHLICQLLLATSRTPSRNPSKGMGTHQALRLAESLPECHVPCPQSEVLSVLLPSFSRSGQGIYLSIHKNRPNEFDNTNSVLLTILCGWQAWWKRLYIYWFMNSSQPYDRSS